MSQRLKIEINTKAIENNARAIRALLPEKTALMAVVKADGYGHGAVEAARAAIAGGALHLGVATAEEGRTLRQSADYINADENAEILILGASYESETASGIAFNLTQTVYDLPAAEKISETAARLNKTAKIQLKVDTGMSRLGFLPDEDGLASAVKTARLKNLEITGIYSHFAESDDPDKTFSRLQAARFADFCDKLAARGVKIKTRHMANSAAVVTMPEYFFDVVRPGIILYGLSPSYGVIDAAALGLTPAMSVKSEIVSLKTFPENTGVSYNRRYFTSRETRVAVIPIGYADAYPRALSGKGKVIINGKFAPLIGSICMDQMMADVTEIPEARKGGEVILIGKENTADEVAKTAGTIGYELICAIGSGRRGGKIYNKGENL